MNDNEAFRSILYLNQQIYDYWDSLNVEGVWLFLATLGCWSVPYRYACIFALCITGALFVGRIYARIPVRRTFSMQINALLDDIEGSQVLTDERRAHYRSELDRINNDILNYRHSIRHTGWFIVCFVFFGLSVYWWFTGDMPAL
jgi:hypothetical protein